MCAISTSIIGSIQVEIIQAGDHLEITNIISTRKAMKQGVSVEKGELGLPSLQREIN